MKVFSWLLLIGAEVFTYIKLIEADTSNEIGFISILAIIISGIGSLILMGFLTEDSEWSPIFAAIVAYLVFIIASFITYYLIIILIIVGAIWFLSQLGGSEEKKYKKTGQIDIYERD